MHHRRKNIMTSSSKTQQNEDTVSIPEKINEADWYRRLSLSSIPRKSSLPASHSRRSSTSDADRTFVRFAKLKPPILA
ncbi:uncharacterized protein TNCT_466232 [Trichonephila clavata]|uniref:Uncharacterized protein n=1 Tax=Trichonephila clavata TaxID=2740835 RepID=A0A8X6M6B3_TRICU|nr:uncharacterized protein TNCT_466232 [Trichonephila clavata]